MLPRGHGAGGYGTAASNDWAGHGGGGGRGAAGESTPLHQRRSSPPSSSDQHNFAPRPVEDDMRRSGWEVQRVGGRRRRRGWGSTAMGLLLRPKVILGVAGLAAAAMLAVGSRAVGSAGSSSGREYGGSRLEGPVAAALIAGAEMTPLLVKVGERRISAGEQRGRQGQGRKLLPPRQAAPPEPPPLPPPLAPPHPPQQQRQQQRQQLAMGNPAVVVQPENVPAGPNGNGDGMATNGEESLRARIIERAEARRREGATMVQPALGHPLTSDRLPRQANGQGPAVVPLSGMESTTKNNYNYSDGPPPLPPVHEGGDLPFPDRPKPWDTPSPPDVQRSQPLSEDEVPMQQPLSADEVPMQQQQQPLLGFQQHKQQQEERTWWDRLSLLRHRTGRKDDQQNNHHGTKNRKYSVWKKLNHYQRRDPPVVATVEDGVLLPQRSDPSQMGPSLVAVTGPGDPPPQPLIVADDVVVASDSGTSDVGTSSGASDAGTSSGSSGSSSLASRGRLAYDFLQAIASPTASSDSALDVSASSSAPNEQMIVVATVATAAMLMGALFARRIRTREFLSGCIENETLEDDVAYDTAYTTTSSPGGYAYGTYDAFGGGSGGLWGGGNVEKFEV